MKYEKKLPTEPGWYPARVVGENIGDHREVVYISYGPKNGDLYNLSELMVSVAGQASSYSEELWRYKNWEFGPKIEL